MGARHGATPGCTTLIGAVRGRFGSYPNLVKTAPAIF
jgi:hypothetical protein